MSKPTQKLKTTDQYVQSLLDEGPDAVVQAIYQRDAIIAKLMHKLGIVVIKLHAVNDLPSMLTRFGTQVDLDPSDPQVITLRIKYAEDYTDAYKRSLN